jgi:CheY-like chemotaxis protein
MARPLTTLPTPRAILVVEDDPFIRDLMAMALEDEGHQVIGAPNGVDALEILEERTPDLILLDLNMPVMDGVAFARALRARQRDVPLVLVSARPDLPEVARSLGAAGALPKPFGRAELIEVVELARRVR